MKFTIEISNSTPSSNTITTQQIEVTDGQHIVARADGNVEITKDGKAAKEVAVGPDGALLITWEDGSTSLLTVLPLEEGDLGPRIVSIDGEPFQPTPGDGELDGFMNWTANYDDSPLPWDPLPPYPNPIPEDDDILYPIDGEEETAPLVEEPAVILPPTFEPLTIIVSEEGLKPGIRDAGPAPDLDRTDSRTAAAKLNTEDPNSLPLTISLAPPNEPLTSCGFPVIWTQTPGGGLLGTVDGMPAIVIGLTSDNTLSIEILKPLDHPDPTTEDVISFSIVVTVSNGTETIQGIVTFEVEDDSPTLLLDPADVDLPMAIVDDTDIVDSAMADFSGAFTILGTFGGDGPASTSPLVVEFSLGLNSSTNDSGLIDTATGNPVYLFLEGGNVVGREGDSSGEVVFTVSVDGDGKVTLDLYRSIFHTPDSGPDQSTTLTSSDLITLTATVTATDKDGDSATKSVTIDIADTLKFKDDGPAIDISSDGLEGDELCVDDTTLDTNDSANFADNFTVDSSSYGNDGAGSTVSAFSLAISSSGVDSGIDDTATGNDVLLFLESGVVVGREGSSSGAIVFTVSVDADGEVTLDQQRAVVHDDPNDHDEASSPAMLSGANTVTLTRTDTITDKDGDSHSDSATLDLTSALKFKDDGPAIDISSDGLEGDELCVDDTTLDTNDSANFADNFTVDSSSYGNDGAGSTVSAFSLAISSSGVDSGIDDTATGNDVLLFLESGVVVGREGSSSGAIVFTVSVDADGEVTLDQQRAVVHDDPNDHDEASSPAMLSGANTVTLTRTDTITDKDGDSHSDSATLDLTSALKFKDDGPAIDISSDGLEGDELCVDDTTLDTNDSANFADNFTVDSSSYGNDGAGSTVSAFSLAISSSGVDSGIDDTATGNDVLLFLESGVVVGREGSSSGAIVFTVSVDADGEVTLDQQRAVVHDDPNDHDEASSPAMLSGANTVTLTRTDTITDKDGDSHSDSATLDLTSALKFKDDGPAIDISSDGLEGDELCVDDTTLDTNDSANFADNFTVDSSSYGNDGAGSTVSAFSLAISSSGVDSGIDDTATGNDVLLFLESGVVVGREGSSSGAIVFTVSVDADGEVTLDQQRAVVHDDPNDHDEASSPAMLSGANTVTLTRTDTITDKDGDSHSDSATLDLTSALKFKDDGPAIDISSDGLEGDELCVDDTTLDTNDSANFADNFTVDSSSYGNDGAGSTVSAFSLAISSSGVDSGIDDTATGNDVLLFLESGVVVGREGSSSGAIVFTVSVDADGEVTLDQQRAVVHDDPNDHDEASSPAMLSGANTVTLTRTDTITDKDGDSHSDSATLDLTSALKFKDDGPAIDISSDGLEGDELCVDDTTLDTNDSANFADNFTVDSSSYGNDGAGSTVSAFSLAISSSGVDSGIDDTATGNDVLLFLESGVVVGREGSSSGAIVFTVSVDADGEVTLDQQRAVVHDDPNDHDEASSPAMLSGANTVTLTRTDTITDKDGDSHSDSATLDLTSALKFKDDGPAIDISSDGLEGDELCVDDTTLDTNDSANFADNFTVDSSSYGNDGAGSTVSAFSLAISSSGVDSGIDDTATGNDVLLFLESGVVVGREGSSSGAIVFTVSVDADGEVTLDQQRAVVHDDPNDHDEASSPAMLSGANTVTLTRTDTITDKDGDSHSDSATLDLTSALKFKDDGPAIDISSDGLEGDELCVDDTTLDTNDSANFADNFTVDSSSYGNDGAGSTVSAFSLAISSSGVDSGIDDTATGNDVLLFLESGVVVGREGSSSGAIVFTVSVDADGEVTLDQQRAVVHDDPNDHDEASSPAMLSGANTVTLTRTDTITDKDGDSHSDSATLDLTSALKFKDDGPAIDISSDGLEGDELCVDDTTLDTNDSANFADNFTVDSSSYGNDGAGSTVSAFSLAISSSGVDSGIDDTATGNDVLLFLESGVVVGREGSSSGAIVFTVSVDADGEVTLDQQRAVVHDDPNDHDEASSPAMLSGANTVTLTRTDTITDKDGDSHSDSATLDLTSALKFKDDGPAIDISSDGLEGDELCVDDTTLDTNDSANFADNFTVDSSSYGNDGAGSTVSAFSLAISSSGVDSGIDDTATGNDVLLFLESGVVVGREGSSSGAIVFTVSVDADGEVTLDQQRAVVHDDPNDHDEASSPAMLSGANTVTLTRTDTITDKDGDSHSDSATLDLTSALKFKDDGPAIDISSDGLEGDELCVDDTTLDTNDSANFADNFTVDSSSYGNDGAGSTVSAFSLAISSSGVDSGIDDTATGNDVLLFLESGVVVGREGSSSGAIVFTVSVDADGEVTLDQQRAVVHDDPNDHDEASSPAMLSGANTVTLTRTDTITDKDGDSHSDSATLDLTSALKFKDDGPAIDISSDGLEGDELCVDDTTLDTNDSANFADNFTVDSSSYGNDGAGSTVSAFSLAISSSGVDSGIDDTATGNDVLLFLESGVVVGREGSSSGAIVFTVSVDADGEVTLDQQRAVVHDDPNDHDEASSPAMLSGANTVTLTRTDTITDKDGDSHSDSATLDLTSALKFKDDGPAIDISSDGLEGDELCVDDTTLDTNDSANFADNFTVDSSSYGNDGAGSTVSAFSLAISSSGVDSGIDDTATGNDVLLFLESGVVVGREGSSSGAIVFTVSVDADGEVTLDQQRAVVHDDPNDHDEASSPAMLSGANTVTLTRTDTITDKDGDSHSDSATLDLTSALKFKDDGPAIDISSDGLEGDELCVDDTTLDTNDSANFADNFTVDSSSYGNDGAGSTVSAFSLAISSSGVDSGIDDTATGNDVLLFLESGVVVGREGSSSGAIVFTVSVDADGEVTLDQQRAVVHDDPNDHDEASSPAMLSGANTVTLTRTDTITDKDGDSHSDSATLDLTSALKFKDDGPAIDISSDGLEGDELCVDDTTLDTNDSANFADNFTVDSSSYGNDGAGSTVSAFSLAISSSGVDSGIDDTATGNDVLLFLESGVVVGREGSSSGAIVFTVSVDADGEVTLDQQRAVVHDDPNDHDEASSPAMLSGANTVTLTRTDTITDKDGDSHSDSATLDLTSALKFKDDGPAIDISSDGLEGDELCVDDTTLDTNDSANFADNFTVDSSSYGNDGAGSTVSAFSLAISSSGVDSGIDDTATGNDVLLFLESGVVVGREGSSSGAIVFTVSVDADGEVTLDQQRAVVHDDPNDHDEASSPAMLSGANTVTLTRTDTITDKDGDSHSDSATLDLTSALKFKDDGPEINSANAAVQLDDETLTGGIPGGTGDVFPDTANTSGTLAHDFGADGAGSVEWLDTGAPAGFTFVKSGDNLLIKQGATTVITVTMVTATGAYTVTQNAAIAHPAGGDENDVSFTLSYRVTDGDGDFTDGTLTINSDDDTPTTFAPDTATLVNTDGVMTGLLDLDVDGNIDNNVGADQVGSINFANITDGDQATGIIGGNTVNLTSGGENIQLYLVDHDSDSSTPDQLQGWTGGLNTGTKIFTVTLNHDPTNVANDTYQVDLLKQIGATEETTLSNLGFSEAGNKLFNYIDVDGTTTTEDLMFSGYERDTSNATTHESVNTNSTSIGVGNQSMNDGENLRIDFVNSPSVSSSANNTYDYATHYNVNNFSFAIVQKGGGLPADSLELWVRIYDADNDDPAGNDSQDHTDALSDDPQLNTITEIKVNGVALTLGSLTTDGNGGYLLTGLDLNDVIVVAASGAGYNRIEIENALSMTHGVTDSSLNGDSFDIGTFGFEKTLTNIPSVELNFDAALTDADGDTIVVTDAIEITLTSPTPPIVLDLDGDGLEFLSSSEAPALAFDLDGDGELEQSSWVGEDDALLVHDANNDQIVNDGSEIQFAHLDPDAETDLEGLRLAHDSNNDGVFDANDEKFDEFGIWQDIDSDGKTDPGEYTTLEEAGIVSIDLNSDEISYLAADGEVVVQGETSFLREDGSEGIVGDVLLSSSGDSEEDSSPMEVSDLIESTDSVDDLLGEASEENEGSTSNASSEYATADSGTDSSADFNSSGDDTEGAIIVPESEAGVDDAPPSIVV